MALTHDLQHRLGEQVVERPPVTNACAQVRARHLEPRHLDVHPPVLLGKLDRCPRPVDNHERRPRDHLVVALPGRDAGCRVVADDREQLRARVLPRQRGEGVRREAGAAHVDLRAPRDEPVDVRDGSLDHREPVGSRRDLPRALLLPRQVGHHQHDEVEAERVADVDSGDEMADMRWVEGTPEQPESQRVVVFGHGGRV